MINWNWLKAQALIHKKRLIAANIIAIVATLISVPIPLLMPLMVDEVLLNQPGAGVDIMKSLLPSSLHSSASYITVILLAVVFMRVASQALNILQSRQFTLAAKDISFRIRHLLIEKLNRISMREFEVRGSGGMTSHLVTDVETVDKFLGQTLSKFIVSLLTVTGTAIILLWLDWRLGLFILLLNPIIIFISRKISGRVKHLKKRENESFENFQQRLVDTLDGLYQLRAANRERVYLQRLKESAEDIRFSADKYAWQSEAAGRLSFLMFLIGFEVFRAVAMLMVLFSDLTIGQIFAVFGYLWFMLSPVQELLGIQIEWYSAKAAIGRLNAVLDIEEEQQPKGDINPFSDTDKAEIQVDNVSFAYDSDKQVLDGMSLSVPAGKRVALVGASGGGKSTLIQLLLGLYLPQSGDIRYNGISMRETPLRHVRTNVAVVLQHPVMFNDTLRANLCLGETFDDDRLWQALSIAQLDDVVPLLTDGLDTLIGRNGMRLSGGQRQRVAIARMVLSNPQIVILDEATSALDTLTESRLHTALNLFLKGRTTLIVAHRLSAVQQADIIYVLEDGRVSQKGTHRELVSQQGAYQTLYGNQSVSGNQADPDNRSVSDVSGL